MASLDHAIAAATRRCRRTAPRPLPEEVGNRYPDVAHDLLRTCRVLMLAMITTWRWDRDDQFPNGRQQGVEWLGQLRAALDRRAHAVIATPDQNLT